MIESGHWDGVCPYIFEGENAGKYRHPHIAFASLEVYLANMHMPEDCHPTWLENNPWFIEEGRVTTDTPFPVMSNDDKDAKSVENWLGQPVLPWVYDSGDAKDASPVMLAEDSAKLINVETADVDTTESDGSRDTEVSTDTEETTETEDSSDNEDDIGTEETAETEASADTTPDPVTESAASSMSVSITVASVAMIFAIVL